MVLSPYGNDIITGGSQERKYLNDGYIVVSNKLCEATYSNIKKLVLENYKNNNLREIEIPDHCRALYIDAIHELIAFPYAKYLLAKDFIKSQFSISSNTILYL